MDDGTVFETSREPIAREAGLLDGEADKQYQSLTVEVGEDQIITGLENALVGLEKGSEETVSIPPEDGYGEWTKENVREYETEEFNGMIDGESIEEGESIETQNGSLGKVVHVDDELVRVDFNHPLAGANLEFEIEVVDINDE
jgi:FKBP-type peptidyl-prolyl cis-trans isomerase 2